MASPYHLHDPHICMALRAGADAICEKPLVLNCENILRLKDLEVETGRRVWTILQLRTHEALLKLKQELDSQPSRVREVDLTYITSWCTCYLRSWRAV